MKRIVNIEKENQNIMKNKNSYDFSGWATKNNILCSDGRTILKDAFKQNDGQKVPLVWNHQHNDPSEVLGHALLENRNEGVYAYCKFNNTEAGQTARSLVNNGDIDKLSIYANKLNTQQNNVTHGCIREVSLVLAGANPGAFIDTIILLILTFIYFYLTFNKSCILITPTKLLSSNTGNTFI